MLEFNCKNKPGGQESAAGVVHGEDGVGLVDGTAVEDVDGMVEVDMTINEVEVTMARVVCTGSTDGVLVVRMEDVVLVVVIA